MKINLDEHELLDLIWAAVNGSHLKCGYFRDAIRWWKDLSVQERHFLWHYSIRNYMEDMIYEKCSHIGREDYLRFLARYDPRNQYKVTVDDGKGNKKKVNAYKFHNLYFIDASSFCEPKYITEVVKDRETWNKYLEHYRYNFGYEVAPFLAELDKEIEKEVEFGKL